MMRCVHGGSTFFHPGLRYPARSAVPHLTGKKWISTDEDTSVKKSIFRPIAPNDRAAKDWTVIAWPTNIQSATPDGKFGPAKQIEGWGDCWFLATLAAVANDKEGHKTLAESIKKVDGGYTVTFEGAPDKTVFIADSELDKFQNENGGDADTRLMELAADKFFKERGNFRSLYLVTYLKSGMSLNRAKKCLMNHCKKNDIQDPMTHNPIRNGGRDALAFFMLTGMLPEMLDVARSSTQLQRDDIMRFLNQYVTNDRDGISVVINGEVNPLGDENRDSRQLVHVWDAVRIDITRDNSRELNGPELAFLTALEKWLETPDDNTWQALQSTVGNLKPKLKNINLKLFMKLLDRSQIALRQNHRDILRSGVLQVLEGRTGFIGFPGRHSETLEGIDTAAGTFTYSNVNFPTLVHTGRLSHLIQEIQNKHITLDALEPATGRYDKKRFEHGSTSRGRRLLEFHNQVTRDGKIDQAESRMLANLMEMKDGVFRQVYDNDKNGMIEGDELKAVQLRVDRMVEHLEVKPIW